MKTHHEILSHGDGLDGYSNYAGDVIPDNFLVFMGRNRDSDVLTNCNWECALKQLGGESDTIRVDRMGHWAVGWIEYMSVDKNDAEKLAKAQEIEDSLESYPVLDDEAFSYAEQEEADRVWASCYDDSDRLDYIRKHRDQFEFRGFTDLRECVRGEWFGGYASELLS